ncbi:MAG: flippase [Niabella sp.]|nr:flippase [Niabella sp.]
MPNYWIKNGIINIAQQLLTVFFGFLSLYILVRVLSPEEYGTWVLFLATVSVLETARNGLTQEALVKFLASGKPQDKKEINTATFVINMGMTVLIAILLLTIGPWLGHSWKSAEINTMFHLYLIALVFSAILNQVNCIEQAHLSFTGNFLSNTARQFIFLGFVIYCWINKTPAKLQTFVLVQVLSVGIAMLIALLYSYKRIHYSLKFDKIWGKKIFNFGKFTFGVTLSTMLWSTTDQMMLGSMLSKTASGIFNIAVRISSVVDIPALAMATILYPQSSKIAATKGEADIKHLYEKSVGIILAIQIPLIFCLLLFSGVVIHFLGGEKYDESISLLRITLLGGVISPFIRQGGTILNSTGKSKLNFYILLILIVVIIISNLILIKSFGIFGAAYSSLVSGLAGFLLSRYFLKKNFNINTRRSVYYAVQFYPELVKKYLTNKKQPPINI